MSSIVIDPSEEELFREYWAYDTKTVREIYDRFYTIREQASKRVRVATKVIGMRAQDNHQKPPTQFIYPLPLSVGIKTPKP